MSNESNSNVPQFSGPPGTDLSTSFSSPYPNVQNYGLDSSPSSDRGNTLKDVCRQYKSLCLQASPRSFNSSAWTLDEVYRSVERISSDLTSLSSIRFETGETVFSWSSWLKEELKKVVPQTTFKACCFTGDTGDSRTDVFLISDDHDDEVYDALDTIEEAIGSITENNLDIQFHVRATRGRPLSAVVGENMIRVF